jgi:hypothetical protein
MLPLEIFFSSLTQEARPRPCRLGRTEATSHWIFRLGFGKPTPKRQCALRRDQDPPTAFAKSGLVRRFGRNPASSDSELLKAANSQGRGEGLSLPADMFETWSFADQLLEQALSMFLKLSTVCMQNPKGWSSAHDKPDADWHHQTRWDRRTLYEPARAGPNGWRRAWVPRFYHPRHGWRPRYSVRLRHKGFHAHAGCSQYWINDRLCLERSPSRSPFMPWNSAGGRCRHDATNTSA